MAGPVVEPSEATNSNNSDTIPVSSLSNGHACGSQDAMPSIDTKLGVAQLPSPSPTPSPATSHPPALETVPESRTPSPPGLEVNKKERGTECSTNNATRVMTTGFCRPPVDDDSRSSVAVTDSTVSSPVRSEAGDQSRKLRSDSMSKMGSHDGSVRKLSSEQMQELFSAPESLPVAPAPSRSSHQYPLSAGAIPDATKSLNNDEKQQIQTPATSHRPFPTLATTANNTPTSTITLLSCPDPSHLRRHTERPFSSNSMAPHSGATTADRPLGATRTSRTLSTPPINRMSTSTPTTTNTSTSDTKAEGVSTSSSGADHIRTPRRNSAHPIPRPAPLNLELPSSRPGTTPTIPIPAPSRTAAAAAATEPGTIPKEAASTLHSPNAAPHNLPLPPMSLPTHLQLELAGQRPSPLYVYQTYTSDIPYESSAIKFERLKNVLLLPPTLERAFWFGALACLDAWLYTFTILPIRFVIAIGVLLKWWGYLLWKEARWVVRFVWVGTGRMWRRGKRGRTRSKTGGSVSASESERSLSRVRSRAASRARDRATSVATGVEMQQHGHGVARRATGVDHHATAAAMATTASTRGHPANATRKRTGRHRRTKSIPSNLSSFHKADLLQGAVILFSSIFLMNLDASRMYHFIRAQSAMKLYVIFNLLEVLDKLLASLGQDIFECLFSSETLSRNSLGRSKVLLPFAMFLLSLVYNVLHAVALFFQVITLNVAVNSYSNALLTLLLSNQFVEIKSAVFKRFEKENLFQMTCADIVERFQLWIFLIIIGMRNIVEVGGLSIPGAGTEMDNGLGTEDVGGGGMFGDGSGGATATTTAPMHSPSILPFSFTIIPSWFWSGEVLSPFLIVIGSEMLVDWIKHAYVGKFNNVKPALYGRILDILCKDYYSNAFVTPTLMKRLGLPLLPLSCLFIRASVQTYHMFLATHLPPPHPITPASTQTALVEENGTFTSGGGAFGAQPPPSSPAVKATLERLDNLIRNALGRSVYYYTNPDASSPYSGAGSSSTGWGSGCSSTGGADGAGAGDCTLGWREKHLPTTDDLIAGLTMVTVFFILFLVLLMVKLLLGMFLLKYSRDRYERMKRREALVAGLQPQAHAAGGGQAVQAGDRGFGREAGDRGFGREAGDRGFGREAGDRGKDGGGGGGGGDAVSCADNGGGSAFITKGRRQGGWGVVEVGEERRKVVYEDDIPGLMRLREKEAANARKAAASGADDKLAGVLRYEMSGKRIW